MISSKGDLLEEAKPNTAERAWLRLAAGCAMLKICEQKGVGDEYMVEQYYTLSQLAMDPVKQVCSVNFSFPGTEKFSPLTKLYLKQLSSCIIMYQDFFEYAFF